MTDHSHSRFYSIEIIHGITVGAMLVAGYVLGKTRGQSNAQRIRDEQKDAGNER